MALFSKSALDRIRKEEEGLRKTTILIVDDEEHNLTTLKYTLAPQYNVLTADDGSTALALLENDPDPSRIHMIISDQRMPRMTGVEFLRRSIAITPRTVRVILTGFTDVEAIMDSINQARIYKFILKPFDDHDILLTVRRGLELYNLEERNIELSETLGFFNSRFLHHMRGMLQNVSASTELLGRLATSKLTDDQEELLKGASSSLGELINLVNRASELSYVYTGTRPAEKEQLEITEFIREVGETFRATKPVGLVTVGYHWGGEGQNGGEAQNYYMDVDRELLGKALNEVLENAYAYSDKPATIDISAAVAGNHFTIKVRDRGIGLEQEGGSALLRPFARGKHAGDMQQFGLGIGLANASAFLQAHGGDVYFTNEDKGTTVAMTLPLPDYDLGQPLPVEAAPRRIDIFQEDPEELRLFREVLEFEGHLVTGFATPEDLVESVAANHPDLVLMDGNYKGQSTEASVRRIAEIGKEEHAKVVVIAPEGAQGSAQHYLDNGAHSCISKPVDYTQLTALLQTL